MIRQSRGGAVVEQDSPPFRVEASGAGIVLIFEGDTETVEVSLAGGEALDLAGEVVDVLTTPP